MSPPQWVGELAAQFWVDAGGPAPFPRDLRPAIAWALPVSVVPINELRVAAIDRWLHRRSISTAAVPDRPLRAALVARSGQGFIFLEADDPPDELRFSLAHELAHFLRAYWQPRQRVLARLGPDSRAVLDGERPPTRVERIDSLLSRTPLGYYVHLMNRLADGALASPAIARAEREADLLAWELLAPAEVVGAGPNPLAPFPPREGGTGDRGSRSSPFPGREGGEGGRSGLLDLQQRLVEHFGLPPAQAARYARQFEAAPTPSNDLLRRLGLR